MPRHILRAVFLIALLAGTLGVAAPALAVDTPFSVRYAQTLRGSINAVGNQLLTCPAAAAGCTNARNRVGSATTLNNNYNMEYVDVDGDAATVNSSTATLSLPAGATVTWAGLYWGADTALGTGGSAAPDAVNRGLVRFKVGSDGYQTVAAAPADVLTSTGKDTRYRAFANVTALLPASGNATYTVGNVQTGRGDDRFAGWSLVVAYQDATQGIHRVSVYDGLGTVDSTHTFSTNITPFFTPASGPVATKTGLLAFEGDTGIVGETATFNGTALTDAINGLGNLMNSTMAVDGTLFGAKDPNYGNLMGTDIDVWNDTDFLGHGQSSATLAFASNQDLFVPSALWLVSDEGPAVNTGGPTVGGVVRDGSTLTADPGTWNGTPTITYEYQWQRCDAGGGNCADIPGATGSTYTLTPADVGGTVRVLVTAVNGAGSSAPTASAPTSTVAQLGPSNVTVPLLSGPARDDQTLTTTPGGWNGTDLHYDVQWQRCHTGGAGCTDIAGATAWSYVLTAADIDATVRSAVTASNDVDDATAFSAATETVVADPPANTMPPAITGLAKDGQVLSADAGTWTGTDTLTYAYQWRRCEADGTTCTDIAGATGSIYTVERADVDGSVLVRVTAANVAGNADADSPATAPVLAAPPANTSPPTLSGIPRDGHVLTLDQGTWTGTETIDYDIVWQRCDSAGADCLAIAGATASTYTLGTADIDATVRVLVTASNAVGVKAVQTAPTLIAADPPVNTTTQPSIGGDAVDGETLTADEGTWTGTQPVVFAYQWQHCDTLGACTDITGATNPTYTLTAADVGSTVRVEVTAANAADASTVASPVTATIAAAPATNTSVPTTTGFAADGEVLTAVTGAWSGTPTIVYTYQWERCDADGTGCQVIAAATSSTYTLADADAGQTVRVVVTGTNAGGSDSEHSAPTGVIAGDPPVNDAVPLLSGSAVDGLTLSAGQGDWSGTDTLVYSYQWQRCDADGAACEDIATAHAADYTLTGADIDGTVRAVVTATNGYGTLDATTAPSDLVAAALPVISIDPAVLGTAVEGQTVTADPGIWSGTPPVSFDYQWLRCDADGTDCTEIPGADEQDYVLTAADTGQGIRVEVTATNAAGDATATSPVASVDAAAPQNTTLPSYTFPGTLRDGETLTADPGIWSGTAPVTFDYQWLRCDETGVTCALIAGATEQTYTLGGSDVGGQVRVSLVATNASPDSAQATSAPGGATSVVAADAPQATSAPIVTGATTDGATLTTGTGGWTGTGPLGYTYQWQRCDADGTSCADIPTGTASSYTLTSGDVAGSVRVEVTATNAAGSDSSFSLPTSPVAAVAPVSTMPPAIAGPVVDGATLTADPGAFTGTTPQTFDYQWQRCDTDGTHCADIGTNQDTYELVAADVGAAVQVVVTATNAGGSDIATSALTAAILPLAPQNTTPPSITGDVFDGHTLTADPGVWTGTLPTLTYQWQQCDVGGSNCEDILGATDPTYTLVPGDIAHTFRVDVTADNAAPGTAHSLSAPTVTAEADPPANTAVPTVTGTLEDGQTLTADPGTWSGTSPVTYTYQWQHCDLAGRPCTDIAGADEQTYVLTADDVGHPVAVAVTAHNRADDVTETSVPSDRVAVDAPTNTVPPAVPSGSATDGQTLTADSGTWTGTDPIDLTYAWQRCDLDGDNCVAIPTADGATYTLMSDDIGSTIRVVVTADNGEQTPITSPQSLVVVAQATVSTSPPTVAGFVGAGHTLTAGEGTWDGSPTITFEYQWQRCDDTAGGPVCQDIAGAHEDTYELVLADVGHAIVVVVTATGPGGTETASSIPTAPAAPPPPANTVAPMAPAGDAVDGGTLTADPGTWTGDPQIDITYQWQRCDADGSPCTDIPGEDEATYTPSGADVGHAIVVVVTATNPGGSTSLLSTATAAVAAAPPVNVTAPSITGTAADGVTLTAEHGTWTGTTPIDFEYQWQICDATGAGCTDIPGATGNTYTPGTGDIDHTITVVVTAGNAGGDVTGPLVSATEPVVASAPHDTAAPVVTGTVGLGETLTASPGTWAGTPVIGYEYQWRRCDEDGAPCVDITGATDPTYTLGSDDQGHTVVVIVTATNATGSDTSTSAPSALLPAPPANTVAPTISGDEEVGETLNADPGTWTGTGPLVYTYQWQRCDFLGENCVDIAGETGDSHTLTDGDAGHVITVIVTATNSAGDAGASTQPSAAVRPPAKPTQPPTATPPATATPVPTAAPRPVPRPQPATAAAPPLLGSDVGGLDLGEVPGSLVSDTSCQQLAGNAKYRRIKLRGIGTVRVRAYTAGPATRLTPILVTTQISHAKTKRVRVRYTLDGRKLRAGRRPRYQAAITPSRLQRLGIHKLKATVKGKGKRAKPVVLKLKTVSCGTLFTAQRWRTTAGAGLRLRIDARTELSRLAFKVPAALLPRQTAKRRTVGFMRVFVAGQSRRKRYALKLAPKGRAKTLLKAARRPLVRYVRGGLEVRGLPARSAVAELTLYRVTKRDGATRRKRYRLQARVLRPGARPLKFSVRPRAPR